jgi:hypothetical protein
MEHCYIPNIRSLVAFFSTRSVSFFLSPYPILSFPFLFVLLFFLLEQKYIFYPFMTNVDVIHLTLMVPIGGSIVTMVMVDTVYSFLDEHSLIVFFSE